MSSKYQQYRAKHRSMSDIYHQDPDFQVFREGLKQREGQLERKIEELRERDEEFVKVVTRNNELETSLKVKEDELELTTGVMAENADLQAKVAALTAELSTKATKIEGLKGELNVSAHKLATAISESVSLEDALYISRSELIGESEASGRRAVGLEGRVKELEAELTALNRQMASLRAEDASRRS
ncbi:peroxisomal and mitochondrial division factor 2-like [Nicotiana sylvestris]|uniref:peroxisomal and mitochondrial division factor 2-like n=1 Tax=Nicotiana sylvestris TaxID=4096 RepID=UPI00388CA6FD